MVEVSARHPTHMSDIATPRPLSNLLAAELVQEFIAEVKRTASIEPDASYLVGSLSAMIENFVRSCDGVRERLEDHVSYLKTEPSRP